MATGEAPAAVESAGWRAGEDDAVVGAVVDAGRKVGSPDTAAALVPGSPRILPEG